MLTKTDLTTPDIMDALYWLIKASLDSMHALYRREENVSITLDFESQISRFIRDFGPDSLTEAQIESCMTEVINRQQAGKVYRHRVGRKE